MIVSLPGLDTELMLGGNGDVGLGWSGPFSRIGLGLDIVISWGKFVVAR